MKRLVLFAMALAVVCVMPSCNKERTGITFGDYTGMIVTSYDTVSIHNTPAFPDKWLYLVDLNGDGKNNIRLYTDLSMTPATSAIHCIDEDLTQIVCKEVEKIWYLHADTTYRQDGDTTHVFITRTYTCHKIDETDKVERRETVSIPQAYDAGDLFVLNKNSFPEFVVLHEQTMDMEDSNTYGENTTYQTHYHTIVKFDYDRFPLDEEKYVGFRFTDADRFRYGWMKIKLYNNEGNYFVKLLETAIQE